MQEHKPGDTVYSPYGEAGRFVARIDEGHVVQPIFESDSPDVAPWCSGIAVWATAHRTPPRVQIEHDIAALQQKADRMKAEISQLREQKTAAEREQNALLERLKTHAALRYVDDYIAGKHALVVCFPVYGEPTIGEAAKLLEDKDRDYGLRHGQKLLVLFGDSKGDLRWRISEYRDGSGNGWNEVLPVASEQEGIEEIRRRYALHVEEWRARPDERKHYGEALSWTKLPSAWLTPPDDVLAYLRARRRDEAYAAADKARAALADAERLLAAA